jgi:hypothetical protein
MTSNGIANNPEVLAPASGTLGEFAVHIGQSCLIAFGRKFLCPDGPSFRQTPPQISVRIEGADTLDQGACIIRINL